ncbi:DUF4190 domain-containing protein [Kineococcus rubinsiae]|uniref:DUF4190 domain-containing protein n=1 Tax=Kineococcus rubinsiae TaxID=2609562 RepID=UPI00142F4C83|nr:DUF4190 domain-containing protein [Kineococcus rubinsiae]
MEPFPSSPPPGGPWAPPGPRGTDGFAIASLVTGLAGLGAVPLALGLVGLQRTRRSGAAGHGMAVAGVVLGAVSLVAGLVLVAAFAVGAVAGIANLARSAASPGSWADDSSRVLIDDLAVGDCLDYGDPDDTDAVLGVDCGSSHEAEVVEVVTLPGTGAYPGDDAVDSAADAQCSDVVAGALDAAGVDTATVGYDYFLPLPTAWDAGRRDVACLVTGGDDDLTGSLTTGTLDAPAAEVPSV